MSQGVVTALSWLTIDYQPHPEERSFIERANTLQERGIETTVAVLSDREGERIFGVPLARHGLQAVWLEVTNGTEGPLWLDRSQLDPDSYTPFEAAQLMHFAMGRRLVEFGLLGWLVRPLLPLLPLKLWAARAANQRMDKFFRAGA